MGAGLALCSAAAGPAVAQELHARVTEEGSERPVAGAMVVLIGPDDAAVDAAVTDPFGGANLTARGAGPWRLVVERIGYRTVTAGPLDPSDSRLVVVRVPVDPIPLAAIEVRAEPVCRLDPSGPRSAAVLWDEARKALERVLWTRGRRDHRFEVTVFERRLNRTGDVVEETSSETVTTGLRPFATAPPEWLAEHGFVHSAEEDTIYFGPDAEVLLSHAFARTHCFYVREDRAGGRLGLAFEPIHEDRDDVTGTLWLDARTAALNEIDFAYVGPVAGRTSRRPEGRMELRGLPDGGWIVERWSIRMPTYRRQLMNTTLRAPRRRYEQVPIFTGWIEREGRVVAVHPAGSGADSEER